MKTIKIISDIDFNELEINVNEFLDEIKDKNPKITPVESNGILIMIIEYKI